MSDTSEFLEPLDGVDWQRDRLEPGGWWVASVTGGHPTWVPDFDSLDGDD